MMRRVHPANHMFLLFWQGLSGISAGVLLHNWLIGVLLISVLMALHTSRRIGSEE